MNVQNSLRVDGVMTYNSLAQHHSLARLREGFERAGFVDLTPEPLGPPAALRAALDDLYPRTLIQRLQDADAFEVRDVIRGEHENSYPLRLTAWLEGNNGKTTMFLDPFAQDTADKLSGAFADARGLVPYSRVSTALTSVVFRLGGVALRPRGSVYWLPGDKLPQFEPVAQTVENAAVGGKSAVYMVGHQFDDHAVRAVRDAIVDEVAGSCATIKKEVESGELGGRALEHRLDLANQLREKIALYESLLGVGLEELRKQADSAEAAANTAALLTMV